MQGDRGRCRPPTSFPPSPVNTTVGVFGLVRRGRRKLPSGGSETIIGQTLAVSGASPKAPISRLPLFRPVRRSRAAAGLAVISPLGPAARRNRRLADCGAVQHPRRRKSCESAVPLRHLNRRCALRQHADQLRAVTIAFTCRTAALNLAEQAQMMGRRRSRSLRGSLCPVTRLRRIRRHRTALFLAAGSQSGPPPSGPPAAGGPPDRRALQWWSRFVADINGVIASGKSEAADDRAISRRIFDSYADVPTIARSALGPDARSASASELAAFTDAFRGYIARKYGKRFREFIGGRHPRCTKAAAVNWYVRGAHHLALYLGGAEPLQVDFLVSDRVRARMRSSTRCHRGT